MNLDNYELSTLHYTVSYYIDNANLDEDENEWLNLLKDKIDNICLLYTSPSPRDLSTSRMPSSA